MVAALPNKYAHVCRQVERCAAPAPHLFHQLESRSQVGMRVHGGVALRHQAARPRHKDVAPRGHAVHHRAQLGAQPQVRHEARGHDEEVKVVRALWRRHARLRAMPRATSARMLNGKGLCCSWRCCAWRNHKGPPSWHGMRRCMHACSRGGLCMSAEGLAQRQQQALHTGRYPPACAKPAGHAGMHPACPRPACRRPARAHTPCRPPPATACHGVQGEVWEARGALERAVCGRLVELQEVVDASVLGAVVSSRSAKWRRKPLNCMKHEADGVDARQIGPAHVEVHLAQPALEAVLRVVKRAGAAAQDRDALALQRGKVDGLAGVRVQVLGQRLRGEAGGAGARRTPHACMHACCLGARQQPRHAMMQKRESSMLGHSSRVHHTPACGPGRAKALHHHADATPSLHGATRAALVHRLNAHAVPCVQAW